MANYTPVGWAPTMDDEAPPLMHSTKDLACNPHSMWSLMVESRMVGFPSTHDRRTPTSRQAMHHTGHSYGTTMHALAPFLFETTNFRMQGRWFQVWCRAHVTQCFQQHGCTAWLVHSSVALVTSAHNACRW